MINGKTWSKISWHCLFKSVYFFYLVGSSLPLLGFSISPVLSEHDTPRWRDGGNLLEGQYSPVRYRRRVTQYYTHTHTQIDSTITPVNIIPFCFLFLQGKLGQSQRNGSSDMCMNIQYSGKSTDQSHLIPSCLLPYCSQCLGKLQALVICKTACKSYGCEICLSQSPNF
jgi:hypothetical protein